MFIAWREIRRSAGRFGVIAAVIALVAFLVVALSALTAGLEAQSISAVRALPGTALAVQRTPDGKPATLVDSRLDAASTARITAADPSAEPFGAAMSAVSAGSTSVAVALLGHPGAENGGAVLAPATAATLRIGVGAPITIGGVATRVAAISDTGSFAHTPVVELPMPLWRAAAHRDEPSAMILFTGIGAVPGVAVATGGDRTGLVPGYSSEHGSLLLVQALLMVISAVVVGAFFAVWTGQRVPSLAVVRAMGASRGYLLRDGLGQAAVVLAAGLLLGALLGVVAASAAAAAVPTVLSVGGVLLPVAAMGALGLLGAALALRPLITVDPLTALNR